MALENGANFRINGFTKLGNDAPAIKTKKLTLICASINNAAFVAHGLTQSKIIGYSCIVLDADGSFQLNATGIDTEPWYYSCYVTSTHVGIYTGSGATNIAGRTATILITYEE